MKKLGVESFSFAALITLAGGFLDAYTYCCRDKVFANAQTGNVVHVGIAVAQGDFHNIARYIIPIAAFACGVLLAMAIRERAGEFVERSARHILLLEIAAMCLICFIPISPNANIAANVVVSFICALQAETFRKVNGLAFASTMCTGNLRSGSEHVYKALRNRNAAHVKDAAKYFCIILIFIAGGAIGYAMCTILGGTAIITAALPLIAAIVLV